VRVMLLSLIIILVDQASKLLVRGISIPAFGIAIEGMPIASSRPILGDFFRLTYIENPGMAFGIDIGGKLFFSIFSIVASIAIVAYLYHARTERLGLRLSLAMILGGAVGNLIDRVFYGVLFQGTPLFHGRVVDFFDLDFFDINFLGYQLTRWPVFNVADASVTIGVLLLLFFHRSVRQEEPVSSSSPPVNAPVVSDPDPPPAVGKPRS
jgi:signal peptidase II